MWSGRCWIINVSDQSTGRNRPARIWEEDREQCAAGDITVGIMGIGELGMDAARKLRSLGFNVSGWSRTPKQADGITCFSGQDGLGAFLASADIFVVLLPLTPDTRTTFSTSDLFARMTKRGPLGAPVLINAGRGGLQNEADILEPLDRGPALGSDARCVPCRNRYRSGKPVLGHPKVTLTPHAAAASMPSSLISTDGGTDRCLSSAANR
jgi:glyoxylate/hydroxypyruvate reductase A